jgi:transcriptional regulator GlxA family with amidase domain
MFFQISHIVLYSRHGYRIVPMLETKRKIGFFFIEGFALMSGAAAVEPLRAANLLANKPLYDICYFSKDGGPTVSSCGAPFYTEPLSGPDPALDILFIVAGGDAMALQDPAVFGLVRSLAAHGTSLGGISGGPVLLAKAGVMKNRRFTVHWEHFEELRELSDRFLMERRLYIIDRDRYTCAGGMAPLDMMHALIQSDHGIELAHAVTDWFIHTQVRSSEQPQRSGFAGGNKNFHPIVLNALDLMENHIADPLSFKQIAMLVGVGERQLQRRFDQDLKTGPMQCYLDIRLEKADELTRKTRLSFMEVALTTGFVNQGHFAKTFKTKFGMTPTERRRRERD